MDQIKIGRFIASRRRKHGRTQSQLAEKLGITDKAVSKWETGKPPPDLSLLTPLSSLFRIALNELLSGELTPDDRLKEKSNQVLFKLFPVCWVTTNGMFPFLKVKIRFCSLKMSKRDTIPAARQQLL